MGKLKFMGGRFYFLAQKEVEKQYIKNFLWDKTNSAYYTDDILKAENLKMFSCDDETRYRLSKLQSNREYSYAKEPSCKDAKIYPELFDFQNAGVYEILSRLVDKRKALLSDEQGLGKTIQTVKVIDQVKGKVLIVCPASLKLNWSKEIFQWSTEVNKVQVIKTSKDWLDNDANIVIVNYEMLTKEHIRSQLIKSEFRISVCDEAHYVKNMKALRAKALLKILRTVKYKLFLTGTPMLNKPIELYSILHCMEATDILKPYSTYIKYAYRYCNAYKGKWGFDVSGNSNLEELNKRLRSSIMVRREKKEVLHQLPDKNYQVIPLEDDEKSKRISSKLEQMDIEEIKKKPEMGSVGEIAQIRHALAMNKLNECITHIKDTLEGKQKVVVFAHHRAVIEKLKEGLEEYEPVIFNGGMSSEAKENSINQFQNTSECRVFIGQIQSAGVGITLTAADTVIFVESSWVPGEVEQAVDRCHRIGQKNSVTAQFLVVTGSLDQIMIQAIIKKKNIINKVVK